LFDGVGVLTFFRLGLCILCWSKFGHAVDVFPCRNKRNQTFLLRIDDRGCLAFSSMLQFLRVHPDHGMGCNACQISVLISNIDVIEMNVFKCPKNHFQTFVWIPV